MLSDRQRELLSAYVDGETTPRQYQAVLRLLERSAEARALARKLQEDAARLHCLPRHVLSPDFSQRVLEEITQQPAPRPLSQRPVPIWAGLTAAAALLLAVGLSAYTYFILSGGPATPGGVQLVKGQPGPEKTLPPQTGQSTAEQNDTNRDKERPPIEVPEHATRVAKGPERADSPMPPPDPPPSEEEIRTKKMDRPRDPSRIAFGSGPKAADLPLFSQMLPLKEFDKVAASLKKEPAVRLELPCIHGNKAFERLQKVLNSNRIVLLTEQQAQYRLRKQLPTDYVLYLDDLTPDELIRVFRDLVAEDQRAEKPKPGDALFDKFLISRMTDENRNVLVGLLQDYAKLLPPLKTELGNADKSAKPFEHQALVLSCNPAGTQKKSAEVKKFFEGHKPRPQAMQVLIVVRDLPG